jgi:ANTAR domain
VRSALAFPLQLETTGGALNLYARLPGAYGATDRAIGAILAALAAVGVSAAVERRDEKQRMTDLRQALQTRDVIGQAKGILMERECITADQAFDVMRRASQHLNEKLRDVAQDIVDTGDIPTDPDRDPSPDQERG